MKHPLLSRLGQGVRRNVGLEYDLRAASGMPCSAEERWLLPIC